MDELAELWRRVMGGEDPAAVLADLEDRHAQRAASTAARAAELRRIIDECVAEELRRSGRLH